MKIAKNVINFVNYVSHYKDKLQRYEYFFLYIKNE